MNEYMWEHLKKPYISKVHVLYHEMLMMLNEYFISRNISLHLS